MDEVGAHGEATRGRLWEYYLYNFLRELDAQQVVRTAAKQCLDGAELSAVQTDQGAMRFYHRAKPWDSDYFGFLTRQLTFIDFQGLSHSALVCGLMEFRNQLTSQGTRHLLFEVPACDTQLVAALGAAGFSLVETRPHFYLRLENADFARRAVREAKGEKDAEQMAAVARSMVNPLDRFHADPAYTPQQADAFLATYARQAVLGFCDCVVMPAEGPGDGLVAFNYFDEDSKALGIPVARLSLVAVGPGSRGWSGDLLAEAMFRSKEKGAKVAVLSTQAANRAMIRSLERLGFSLGTVTHIFSYFHRV